MSDLNILTLVFSLVTAAAACVLGNIFTIRLFRSKEKPLSVIEKRVLLTASAAVALLFAVLLPLFGGDLSDFSIVRAVFVISIGPFVGFIDYKLRIIPNKLVVAMLAAAVIFYGVEAIVNVSLFVFEGTEALVGCAVCFIIFLVGRLISHNGMGMGDVKYAAVLGLLVGIDCVMGVLLWSLISAALTGAALMIFKKAKAKTKIPLGPFFFFGSMAGYLIYIISGLGG